MKSLVQYLNESKSPRYTHLKLTNMTDEELLIEYWRAWSGYYTGRNGLAGNPSIRLGATLPEYIKNNIKDGYKAMNRIMDLHNIAMKKYNLNEFDANPSDLKRVEPELIKLVKNNIEWLTSGKGEIKK